jgi:predicted AlkP superfamily phosphohydrolase/phosphomutase
MLICLVVCVIVCVLSEKEIEMNKEIVFDDFEELEDDEKVGGLDVRDFDCYYGLVCYDNGIVDIDVVSDLKNWDCKMFVLNEDYSMLMKGSVEENVKDVIDVSWYINGDGKEVFKNVGERFKVGVSEIVKNVEKCVWVRWKVECDKNVGVLVKFEK